MHTCMNVMQILTTQGIHSYRLATVHVTATPNRNHFMKKSNPQFVPFTDTQHLSWSMNSIQFYTTYERIKDKAYRGILAVVKIKTEGTN